MHLLFALFWMVSAPALCAQPASSAPPVRLGVRKVLGSSVGQIVALLTKDFAALVLVSFMVAVALVVALPAVSVQALRAASTDPVRALRRE